MEDRTVLQGLETKFEGQDLCRYQRKRPFHPDLDSIDRDAADQVPSVQIQVLLVAVEHGGFFTVESFYLPGLMGMDR